MTKYFKHKWLNLRLQLSKDFVLLYEVTPELDRRLWSTHGKHLGQVLVDADIKFEDFVEIYKPTV